MYKRGQTTLFIILGIVIVIIVLLLVLLTQTDLFKQETGEEIILSSELQNYKNTYLDCLDEMVDDAFLLNGLQGGYYDTPLPNEEFEGQNLPYFLYNGQNLVISKNNVEEELELYLYSNILTCGYLFLQDPVLMETKNIEVSLGDKTNVLIEAPLYYFKGDEITLIEDKVEIERDYPIQEMLAASSEVVQSFIDSEGDTCLTCLVDIGDDYDVLISQEKLNAETLIRLEHRNVEIKEQPYQFAFMIE